MTTPTTETRGLRMRLTATGFDVPLAPEPLEAPPTPDGDQVVVRVEACGVCYRDLIERSGRFPYLHLPMTPGHEAVGRVMAVGPAVTDLRPGMRVGTLHRDHCGECDRCRAGDTSLCPTASFVFGILADGGYATWLVAPERALYRADDAMPAPAAAVLMCTFGTAYRDLRTLGGLEAGEKVLVTGANGGVGSAAVQIAARLGSRVVATVRDARHRPFVERMGAHEVIVDADATFHKQLGDVDLAVDTVGSPTFHAALRSVRIGGRIVTVGNVVPDRASLNLGYVITMGLTIRGGSGATARDMAELLALHRERPFEVPIDRMLPLAEAERAQRLVRAGGLEGRVVLDCGGGGGASVGRSAS